MPALEQVVWKLASAEAWREAAGTIDGPTVSTPPWRWSVTPPVSDLRRRSLDAVSINARICAMAQARESQPHLSEMDLGPEVKSVLEEISRSLENNWDQGTKELQFVTRYEGIRELLLKLMNHREELKGKDFRFMRFKTKCLFESREPVYFFPLRTKPGTSPLISTATLEVGKRISVMRDEEVTPEVDVLVVKQ